MVYKSNLFHTLELEAFKAGITPRTRQSRDWFRKRISLLRGGRIHRRRLMTEDPVVKQDDTVIGKMYHFFYDPKHKETLPYYDTFPLVIVIGPAAGGFLGLNLHYLPPILRAKFLDALMEVTSDNNYDTNTKFNITYDLLKRAAKMKYFKPCIKHYLYDHVKSDYALIPGSEWEIAVFLPTGDFRKAGKNEVYVDSRRIINK